MSREDALLMGELCMSKNVGQGEHHVGVTMGIFIERYLMQNR